MRDQQNRRAFFFQKRQGGIADPVAQAIVEARKGLIHQHDARARGQGAGQGHALLLTARQLMRVLVRKAGQIDLVQQLRHPPGLLGRIALQAKGDVARHGQMRKQREILKHQPNAAGFGRQVDGGAKDFDAINPNAACIRPIHPSNHPQRGGFSAARRAKKAHHLARLNRQRHL